MSDEPLEARLRAVEQKLATFEAQLAPLLGVQTLLSTLSNQVTELRGELKTLKGQAVVLCAVASAIGPVLMKILHI